MNELCMRWVTDRKGALHHKVQDSQKKKRNKAIDMQAIERSTSRTSTCEIMVLGDSLAKVLNLLNY